MRPISAIRIPQPCSQSWVAMTPTSTGRHCTTCAKVVVDFTQQTDAEILAYLARATGTSCGRIRADQLVRPLQPAQATSRWRTWLGAVLAAGSLGALLVPKASAQTPQYTYAGSAGPIPATPASGPGPAGGTATLVPPTPVAPTPLPGGPIMLRGTVREASTHEPLPGVTVLLKGTSRGVGTDAAGEFSIPIAAEKLPVQIVVSFVGYENVERTITAAELAQPLDILLTTDTHMLMGEVVVTYAPKPPMPWHPRRFFNWGKYWLKRPLQQ